MKKESGLTLIALVIIIVAIGMILYTGYNYAKEYMNNQKNEDRKAEMLAIQTVITNIQNKHTVDEEQNALVGISLNLENNESGYNITDEFKNSLQTQTNAILYILTNEDLKKHGIENTNINENEFYVVDYNSGEIFYSLGLNGKYKLSEM